MGQAKQRGTFIERRTKAIKLEKEQKEMIKRLKTADVMPPPFVVFRFAVSPDETQIALMLKDEKHNCILDQMVFPYDMYEEDKGKRLISLFRNFLKVNYVM